MGNCLYKLLIRQALANINVESKRTKGGRYHPRFVMSVFVAASKHVAPAGGWMVLVTLITTDATATESAPASHRKSSNRAGGRRAKSLVMPTPMTADRKCPRI